MKKGLLKILALSAVTAMGLSIFAACAPTTSTDLSGYVAVDINPSVEFITDAKGKVSEVRATNEDGQILLSDLDLAGMEISVAVETITRSSEETGFINQTNTDVSITVGANSQTAEKQLNERAEKGVKKGSKIAKVMADEIKQALADEVAKIKATNPELYADLTVAKLKVINSIMEYDRSFTVEMGVKMDMKQLVHVLREYIDEKQDLIEDELEMRFDEAMNTLAEGIYKQIDNIYALHNDQIATLNEQLRKLEMLEDKFEYELEKTSQPDKHEFHFNRDFDFDDDDDDDDDNLQLTVDMKAEITLIIGENTITTLEQLDDYIDDLEDRVDEIMERVQAQLTEEQKATIATLKAQIKGLKTQALEIIQVHIDAAKAQLKQHKEQLRNGAGKK